MPFRIVASRLEFARYRTTMAHDDVLAASSEEEPLPPAPAVLAPASPLPLPLPVLAPLGPTAAPPAPVPVAAVATASAAGSGTDEDSDEMMLKPLSFKKKKTWSASDSRAALQKACMAAGLASSATKPELVRYLADPRKAPRSRKKNRKGGMKKKKKRKRRRKSPKQTKQVALRLASLLVRRLRVPCAPAARARLRAHHPPVRPPWLVLK